MSKNDDRTLIAGIQLQAGELVTIGPDRLVWPLCPGCTRAIRSRPNPNTIIYTAAEDLPAGAYIVTQSALKILMLAREKNYIREAIFTAGANINEAQAVAINERGIAWPVCRNCHQILPAGPSAGKIRES